MRNQVQLIAYADRLGGSLAGLHRLLDGPLAGLFGGVHVLPFYLPFDGARRRLRPCGPPRGRPAARWLGRPSPALGRGYDTVADVVVNHASASSPQFSDVVTHGDASPHAGMFLTYGRVFPRGATEADLLRVYRPRPGLPFTPVTVAGSERRLFWTTFTSEQVDLDVEDPGARAYLGSVLERLAAAGVAMVRLDAAGYAVKRAGTSCFLLPRDDGVPRRADRAGPRARDGGPARAAHPPPPPARARQRPSTGSTTSRCRRWCCTGSRPVTLARCAAGSRSVRPTP